MQAPKRIQPSSLNDYLEVMSKAIFQTGISWRVVENKWPGIKEALRGFDVKAIANFYGVDLEQLIQDRRVIRNRRKLEAIVTNARRMIELDRSHGNFQNYLCSHGDFESRLKDLRKQFKFLGDTGAYYFLWVMGEEVPLHEQFLSSRGITPP